MVSSSGKQTIHSPAMNKPKRDKPEPDSISRAELEARLKVLQLEFIKVYRNFGKFLSAQRMKIKEKPHD